MCNAVVVARIKRILSILRWVKTCVFDPFIPKL